jgi:hypothetical protein
MRWVVRIEREDDGSESDVIRIERSRMEDAAGLGLTLEDGKRIMALLQKRVLADQLREHCRSSRLCSVCARTRAIKDCRQRVIDTIFGRLRVDAPRYERCRCGADRHPPRPSQLSSLAEFCRSCLGFRPGLELTCRIVKPPRS